MYICIIYTSYAKHIICIIHIHLVYAYESNHMYIHTFGVWVLRLGVEHDIYTRVFHALSHSAGSDNTSQALQHPRYCCLLS